MTAWLPGYKLMQVMSEREADRQLDGRVEIDDAYLGGELLPRLVPSDSCARLNIVANQVVARLSTTIHKYQS
ncbi:MAG: hypothetical protein IPF74_08865 [Rhodocyclaceae bacterium]|nr:hypothetical protein [Rhodocyclaceae bacterium]